MLQNELYFLTCNFVNVNHNLDNKVCKAPMSANKEHLYIFFIFFIKNALLLKHLNLHLEIFILSQFFHCVLMEKACRSVHFCSFY